MLTEETRRKISESMKRHHADRRRKRMEDWIPENQAEADRKTFLDAVEEWRKAGITVAVSQDWPPT